MDVDTVATELYALPPAEFTAARDELAKRIPDPQLRKQVKALRKPTASAHAVNQLAREQPALIDDLLELGEQLRAAMSGGGGDVRALTEQRRKLVNRLVAPSVAAAVRDDVTATLEAATADPEAAEAVRTGRLVKPLRYAGFGGFLAPAQPTPPATTPAPSAKRTGAKAAAKKAAAKESTPPPAPKRDLTALRQRVLDLAGVADDAQRRYDDTLRAEAEAQTAYERAKSARIRAHDAARAAHAEAEKARKDLGRLERQ